jgi:hypothetical protein
VCVVRLVPDDLFTSPPELFTDDSRNDETPELASERARWWRGRGGRAQGEEVWCVSGKGWGCGVACTEKRLCDWKGLGRHRTLRVAGVSGSHLHVHAHREWRVYAWLCA